MGTREGIATVLAKYGAFVVVTDMNEKVLLNTQQCSVKQDKDDRMED